MAKAISIKKESPNEGTETNVCTECTLSGHSVIKKESPNEGTETGLLCLSLSRRRLSIKKESPNEGTEPSDEATRFRLGSKAG